MSQESASEIAKRRPRGSDPPLSKEQTKEEMKKEQSQQQVDPNFKQCQFLVVKKNRLCRQRAIRDCDYCGEHLLVSHQKEGDHKRVPCPLDPSHSCYEHLLNGHVKKCNARKKEMPSYLVEGINGEDSELPTEKLSLQSISDAVLMSLIERIEILHNENVQAAVKFDGCHTMISEELQKFKDCVMVQKHLSQQGALLKIMEEKGLLKPDQMFVEFGAGRGQLGTWVMRCLGDEGVCRSSFMLIDRASQRYKADNRFVDKWGPSIHRIRADIRHLCIERVGPFEKHRGRVVGFCKHLCGVAIDLALRCITDTVGENQLPKGIVMAVCCHHRCEWRWYSGREWLESLGVTEKDFQLMVSIAGWATCGRGFRDAEPRKRKDKKASKATAPLESAEGKPVVGPNGAEHEEFVGDPLRKTEEEQRNRTVEKPNRYEALGLSPERRKEIGSMVKAIFDEGRLRYLRSRGLAAARFRFIDEKFTPENFAIVASQ